MSSRKEKQQTILHKFARHKLGLVGLCILTLVVVLAVGAPLFIPCDPFLPDLQHSLCPPDDGHLLGTDSLGRDLLSRLIVGGRASMSVGLFAVGLYTLIGVIFGSIAGYYGGATDTVVMRIADTVMSFPQFVLILTLTAVVGPGLRNMVIVIGILGWPKIARIVRSQFLALREAEFVEASRSAGASDMRLILVHILPNCAGSIVVAATFGVAQAILTEASLSFLGMGVQPPTPSWGNILTAAQSITVLESMPWLWIPPGLMISITVLSINFVGDALRDMLDPRSKDKQKKR